MLLFFASFFPGKGFINIKHNTNNHNYYYLFSGSVGEPADVVRSLLSLFIRFYYQ